MTTKVKAIPDGYQSVMPYLIVTDAAKAIEFYKKILGAKERMRMPAPGGKVGHAELTFGNSTVMLADEFPDMNALSPATVGGTPVSLMVYVDDVDKVVDRAVAAGAKLIRPVKDQFYGDRSGCITDPFGHQWTISTHVEDVSMEELESVQRPCITRPEIFFTRM
jgi:PhnB protein